MIRDCLQTKTTPCKQTFSWAWKSPAYYSFICSSLFCSKISI